MIPPALRIVLAFAVVRFERQVSMQTFQTQRMGWRRGNISLRSTLNLAWLVSAFALLAAMASQLFALPTSQTFPPGTGVRYRTLQGSVRSMPLPICQPQWSHFAQMSKGGLQTEQKWQPAATAACGSRSCLNVTRVIPGSTHNWTIVTRSPGPNQPAIRLGDKCNPLWWFGNVDDPSPRLVSARKGRP